MIGLRFQEILEENGVATKATKRSIKTECPVCSGLFLCHTFISGGQTKCVKCGKKWSVEGILADILNISQAQASQLLTIGEISKGVEEGLKLDIRGFSNDDEDEAITSDDLPLDEITLPPSFIPVETSEVGMKYLASRNVTDLSLIREHKIHYNALMNAVVFLVYDENLRLVGWQARFIKPFNPKMKMMTSPGMKKERTLYNLFQSKSFIGALSSTILVEGAFDCLKTDIDGYLSVASFGKGVSKKQLEMLLNHSAKNIYIGLDRDAGVDAGRVANQLARYKNVFRILPPDHRGDFGECTKEEVLESIKSAIPMEDGAPRAEVYLF